LSKISAHVNNIALHHSIFALPFAYMGAFLAADGVPKGWDLLWITVAMVGARSAALALDNLIDLKYDRVHPRLSKRPMVTGEVKPFEAIVLILCSLLILFGAVFQLQPICLKLLPVAVLPFLIYPYMKRVTCLCHLVLGIALAMAPAGGFVAIQGFVTLPIIFLCLAVCLWIAGFDIVYGCQDEAFDKAHGLHSMATQFTAAGALKIAKFMHFCSLLCFIAVGWSFDLSAIYYVGVVIALLTLLYQHWIVSASDFSRVTQVYFMRNGIVAIAVFLFTFLAL
jgi:4-hydroxybenzoate polyprenyltransferase